MQIDRGLTSNVSRLRDDDLATSVTRADGNPVVADLASSPGQEKRSQVVTAARADANKAEDVKR